MTIAIDLCALLTPPLKKRSIALGYLETQGHTLICYSHLDRTTTRRALREAEIIHHFDDILYGAAPKCDLLIEDPSIMDWRYFVRALDPPRKRIIVLTAALP